MSNAIVGALRVVLGADTAAFDRGLKGSSKNAKKQFSAIDSAAKKLVGALAGYFSARQVGRFLQGSIDAFADFERQQLVTQQVLRATGNAAGVTVRQIEEFAQALGRTTLASTQEVRDAANQLLTFRSIAGETFERTLNLAQDLATVGFGNLGSATQMLARALEDPERGLNSLRRAGVMFNEEQRRLIEGFMEAGDAASAQEVILKAVEQQVGGAGAAAGGGLAGAYDTLNEEIKLFIERTGAQIAELRVLQGVIRGITSLLAADRAAADPMAQLVDRIEHRAQSIERMRKAMESSPEGMATLQREQLAALEAAQATDKYALAQLRLRQGMEEFTAQRQSEIVQEELATQARDRTTESTARAAGGASRMSEAARQARRVWEETRTPLERYNMELERLNQLLASGAIDQDTFNRAVARAREAFDEARASGSSMAQTLSGQFSNVFNGLISGTQSAKQAVEQLLSSLARMVINRAFQAMFSGGFGGGGGFLGSLFGGFRAMGGPVSAGKAYVVGERGPEIVVPNTSGTVISNRDLQGGGGSVTVNVINNARSEVKTQERQGSGGKTIDVIIDEMVGDKIGTPGSASRRALQANGGIRPQLARR